MGVRAGTARGTRWDEPRSPPRPVPASGHRSPATRDHQQRADELRVPCERARRAPVREGRLLDRRAARPRAGERPGAGRAPATSPGGRAAREKVIIGKVTAILKADAQAGFALALASQTLTAPPRAAGPTRPAW